MATKHGLARGLDALLPETDLPAGVTEIAVSQLDPNPDQPRRTFDTQALEALAESIRQAGVLQPLLVVENGALRTRGTLMLVVSIALGGLMGELLDLDRRLEGFGRWLREKSGNGRDSRFLDGFISATMTVSIGAMAIVGAVEDGIHGDYTILAAKSLMDFVIILVMASSLGKGCLFSAIPVGLLQGSVTLLARLVQPLLTPAALSALALVGSALIFCVGLNLLWEKTIRVANLLPALVVAVAYALLGL